MLGTAVGGDWMAGVAAMRARGAWALSNAASPFDGKTAQYSCTQIVAFAFPKLA